MNTPMAMSPRDAARAIGISRSSLYRLIKQGRIRTVKLGSRTLVPTSALAELIGEEVLPLAMNLHVTSRITQRGSRA